MITAGRLTLGAATVTLDGVTMTWNNTVEAVDDTVWGDTYKQRLIGLGDYGGSFEAINDHTLSPHLTYHEYEGLHPFMDGNGRSGRAIWLWLHAQQGEGHVDSILSLGFREAWHYETLAAGAGPRAHRFDLL